MEVSEQGELTLAFEPDGQVLTTNVTDLVGARREKEPKFPAIRHIYACTVHFSQGLTVDRSYVAALRPIDRSAIYVAMTRHRHSAQLFVDAGRLRSSASDARHKRGASPERALETIKATFYEECLTPGKKLNACDFVSDLQSLLAPKPRHEETQGAPYLEAKSLTLQQMKRRVAQSLGEGALLTNEQSVSGMPNAIFALCRRTSVKDRRDSDQSSSVWDWVKGLPKRVRDAVRALRENKTPMANMNPNRRYRIKDQPASVRLASEVEGRFDAAPLERAVEELGMEP